MQSRKHSSQRDAVYANLCSRTDHPSAEDIYFCLKPEMPNLSIATVYRNLSQLCEDGMAQRIDTGSVVRFDGNAAGHTHIVCMSCGAVADIDISPNDFILCAREKYDGFINSDAVMLYGICAVCYKNNN